MKVKICVLTLLVVGLVLGFAVNSHADLTLATGAVSTNVVDAKKADAKNVVLTQIIVDENNTGANSVTAFTVDNAVGASGDGVELAKISIYLDVNGDGKFDSGDTLVEGATTETTTNYDELGAVVTLTPDAAETFAQDEIKRYLVVADLDDTIVDKHTFGALVGIAVGSGGVPAAVTQPAKTLDLVATHIQFVSANLLPQVATTDNILAGKNLLTLLLAVDDYGNTDTDFVEDVAFDAVSYTSFESTIGGLTATVGDGAAAGGVDGTVGGADFATFAAGVIVVSEAGTPLNGSVAVISHTTAGPVTVVAVSQTNNLEGSFTYCNEVYPNTVPKISNARGIEIFDTDHNGKIDHATLLFDQPVTGSAANYTHFIIGSGYSLANAAVVNIFDAGGVGIRNAGEYGITIVITEIETEEEEDVYDTGETPQISYNGSDQIASRGVTESEAQAFGTAGAIEVDKARPVLISATTQDEGIGDGTATNGVLDGLVFRFSEPVRNVSAGGALADGDSYINLAIPATFGMAFNQGSGVLVGSEQTIPVGETTTNTGITPEINYNENFANARITDYATSATTAAAYNHYYATDTSYGAADAVIETVDGAPMVVHSVTTRDIGAGAQPANNGRIDAIVVAFSEDASGTVITGVDFYSPIASFASGSSQNGIYAATAVTGNGTPSLTFTVTEVDVDDIFDSEATPLFRYDPATTGSLIADAAGNELDAYGPSGLEHAPTIDGAAPVMVKILTGDAYADTARTGGTNFESAGANGRIDKVKIIFSERVKTTGGAENGGTALNNAIGQFKIVHPLTDPALQTKFEITAALGAPGWEQKDTLGDTSTELTICFHEISQETAGMVNGGDTGKLPEVTYTASSTTSSRIVDDLADSPNSLVNVTDMAASDGAAPFLAEGLFKEWGEEAFASVNTYDEDANVAGGRTTGDYPAEDDGNGDGYIDGFTLKFTEGVTTATTIGADLAAFTIDVTTGGELTFDDEDATLTQGASADIWILYGNGDYDGSEGDPDTDLTPALSFDGEIDITDVSADANKLAEFEEKASYDKAQPVIISVTGGDTLRDLDFTFSEPVYAHDVDGENVSFNTKATSGSAIFGYQNQSVGAGASGFTSADVVQVSDKVLRATLNADMTVADIEADLVWVRSPGIFDDANALESGLADNEVYSQLGGAGIRINIFDDVIAPWIIEAITIDYNANGKIDHIRFEFSESIDDASLTGYLGDDMMSEDVSATWQVSNYNGTAMWNLFDGTDDGGKAASIAAGKPAFDDNDPNDAVLYLELQEDLVPANTTSGVGSTDFAPTVTWGAYTLGDFRPNLLDTAVDTDKDPDAVGGVVDDEVGPVIMGVTWSETSAAVSKIAATEGGYMTALFSEVVNHQDKELNIDNLKFTGTEAKLWGYSWINAATLELQVKSDYDFPVNASSGVQMAAWTYWYDAAENNPLVYGAAYSTTGSGPIWEAVSPMADVPYPGDEKTVGYATLSNLSYLDFRDTADTSPHAGESVRIRWYSANVENVDIYVSFNGGESYEIIPGSTTPAADGAYYWTAKMGVNKIKLVATEDATISDTTGSYGVVYDGDSIGASIGAPSGLVMTDMPDDNGAFLIAQFGVSADHLTAANSYQFYREYALDEADPNNLTEVLWAVVAAGVVDDANVQSVIVPTINNTESNWVVRASTGSVISDKAAKEAGDAVATVVFGAAEKAATSSDVLSAASNAVSAAAIDNIAPSALDDFAAGSGEAGIRVSWTAPEDHGIVRDYDIFGVTHYIHGVDAYEVYRRVKGEDEFVLVGSAGPGSAFYNDEMEAGAAVYQYFVKAVDGNPDHIVETDVRSGIAATELSGDFSGDAIVNASDFSIFAANYGAVNEGNEADYVWAYDLNADGVVDASDFSIFAAGYGATLKIAKAAALEMPTSEIPFAMGANIDESTSTYFLNVNIGETETLKGFEFYLSYNTEALEFVENSVNGLVGLNMTSVDEDGIIRVSDWFAGEQFDGTVTLAFRATGVNSTLTFEILNAMVDDVDGLALSTNVSDYEARALPTVYALSQNYPNPFNPTTTIDYSIPKSGNVELVIFNMTGQKVRTLVSGKQDAAFYKIVWDGRNELGENVASGLYFYRLISGSFSKIEKMTLIK